MTGCLPEETWSIYVDGELPAGEVGAAEFHLEACEPCRGLVLALREEAGVIADVVLDRHREQVRAAAPAIGLVPALGIAAVLVSGFLMGLWLPPLATWLTPAGLIGMYEVGFGVVFTLVNSAPALFGFAIRLGAVVSVAVMLVYGVGVLGRRGVTTAAALAAACLFAQTAAAFEVRTGEDDVRIEEGEIVEETLLVTGERITIEGTIDGDLAAIGERVVLRGIVRGNVFTAAEELEVLGTIEGSLHAVGERVTIKGEVQGSVFSAAETLTLHERADVGRDSFLVGESVHVNGRTGRDLFSAAEQVEIGGSVGRDASTRSEGLTLHDTARIAGDLHYQIGEGVEPEIAQGARVEGETTRGAEEMEDESGGDFYMGIGVFLVSLFLAGLLLQRMLPRVFEAELETSSDFLRALGYGAVVLVGAPIVLILCMVTVVGIPIGVIGIFLYLTGLFVSIVVVAARAGVLINGALGREDAGFAGSLIVGLLAVLVAMNLPLVGGLLCLVVIATGLGLLVASARPEL
jgi:cytoskeletal protein CcmA (bactofilin family)